MEQTPNCEAPPPHGSTATTKCEVDVRVLWSSGLTGTSPAGRARNAMTSVVGKARLLESAAMPIDSRRLQRAGGGSLSLNPPEVNVGC